MKVEIEWEDSGREPQCPPDPAFPEGKDLDISDGITPHCRITLPYPARRCGVYYVRCKCGMNVACTTAGRPDDPRSITLRCIQRTH
jgi:hypothetical protein